MNDSVPPRFKQLKKRGKLRVGEEGTERKEGKKGRADDTGGKEGTNGSEGKGGKQGRDREDGEGKEGKNGAGEEGEEDKEEGNEEGEESKEQVVSRRRSIGGGGDGDGGIVRYYPHMHKPTVKHTPRGASCSSSYSASQCADRYAMLRAMTAAPLRVLSFAKVNGLIYYII